MNIPQYDTPFGLLDAAVLILLAVGIPLLGIWDHRRLLRWLTLGRVDARLRHYRYILVVEWILALPLLIWWLLVGRGVAPIGLLPVIAEWQWIAVGVGLLACVLLLAQARAATANPKELSRLRTQLGDLAPMAPRSDEETSMFNVLSITAGICEEIVYRGVLLAILGSLLGVWPAVLLSSLIFGLAHAYQGRGGILKTGLTGLAMALLTVFSGSIFTAILVHAVIDVTSGWMMRAALRDAPPVEETAAVPS